MSLRALFGLKTDRRARQPVVLLTDRLRMRGPRLEDQDAWSSLRLASKEFLQPWEPRWPTDHLTRSAFKRRVRWAHSEASAERAFAFLLFDRSSDMLLGGITISNIRRGPSRSASLGYWVGEPHARQGYMCEAVDRIAEFAFQTLSLVRLEAACLESNHASRALLARCGFQSEGIVRGYLEVDGAVRDHVLYARLAQDPAAKSVT